MILRYTYIYLSSNDNSLDIQQQPFTITNDNRSQDTRQLEKTERYLEDECKMIGDVVSSPRRPHSHHLNHDTANAPYVTAATVAFSTQHLQYTGRMNGQSYGCWYDSGTQPRWMN